MPQQQNAMPSPVPERIIYINRASSLNDCIADLRQHNQIAFDLEADSMFHFKEKVCLIQAASEAANYIIDPLFIDDISPLSQILSDPGITKIFHGADYDVRSLYRDFQIAISGLFDTELASRFLGKTETGLNTVLKNRFNIELEKKYQKKDWSQRPLPDEMIEYAAKDVQYLIPLYRIQKKELEKEGRLEWVEEECRDLSMVRSGSLNERPLFARIKGSGRLERRSLAVLEALLEFRLDLAEQKDRPLFKIISNSCLTKIAVAKPATMEQLIQTNALSEKQLNMYGHQLLKLTRNALAIPADKLPKYPFIRPKRISSDASTRLKKLKQWREKKASELGLEQGVLISNAVLKSVAESNPKVIEDLNTIPELKHWQKNALGKDMISILRIAEAH